MLKKEQKTGQRKNKREHAQKKKILTFKGLRKVLNLIKCLMGAVWKIGKRIN